MTNKIARVIGALHTHTHTRYILKERRKLVYNFLLLLWSKGGSRELLEVSILPRDLVG